MKLRLIISLAISSLPGLDAVAVPRSQTAVNDGPQITTGIIDFDRQIIASGIDETHAVVAADLDGDGDLDAAATDFVDGQVLWFENDGNQNFTSHILDPALAGAYPLSIADLDQDNDIDLLAAGYVADTYVWYENLGAGNFIRHDIDTAVAGPHSLIAWDPDQDGDLDLLAANQDESSVVWYENDGSQNFTRWIIDADLPATKRAEAADFDGDGDWDVVACSPLSDQVVWYENDGNLSFAKHIITSSADWAYFVVPGDLDDDGDQDIAGVSQNDDSVSWYRNDGTGVFTALPIATNAMGARMVQTADLDRDGDLDLVASSVDNNTVGWYENDGSGTFAAHEVDNLAQGAYGVWTVDMDHDGHVDVLSASRDAGEVTLHRQVRAHSASLSQPGATLAISTQLLQTIDPDNSPTELIYTLQAPTPLAGAVRLFDTPLTAGDSFTQADIDNDGLAYVHDGSPLTAIKFSFTVTDGTNPPLLGKFRIVVGDGSVGHWPLNETVGLIAGDLVGENPGTLVAGPVWRPSGGHDGGALEFDGIDDLVDLGTAIIEGGGGLTLALWVQPTMLKSSGRLISKATGTAEQDHYWMISSVNQNQLRFRLKAGGVTSTLIASPPVLAVGEWLHVACTYDGEGMRIHGNGVLLGSRPKEGLLNIDPLVSAAIGNQPAGAGNDGFAGLIDEVHLYNRALSASEITALMTAGDVSAVPGDDRSLASRSISQLHGNFPNPFNPMTTIRYDLQQGGEVVLDVFNLQGRRVRQLVAGHRESGLHSVVWDGRDGAGRSVASGAYLSRLRIGQQSQVRQMMLVR